MLLCLRMKYQARSSIAFRDKFAYGTSALGKEVVHGLISSLLFLYCIQELNMQPTFLALLYLAHNLIGVFCAPFVGILIDNTKGRFGKYKPWVLLGTITNLTALIAIYYTPEIQTHKHLYLCCVYLLWSMTFLLLDIPSWSILSLFNSSVSTRDSMATLPCIANQIGCQLMILLTLPIMENAPDLGFDRYEYLFISVLAFIILLCSQSIFIFILSNINKLYAPDPIYAYLHPNLKKAEDNNTQSQDQTKPQAQDKVQAQAQEQEPAPAPAQSQPQQQQAQAQAQAQAQVQAQPAATKALASASSVLPQRAADTYERHKRHHHPYHSYNGGLIDFNYPAAADIAPAAPAAPANRAYQSSYSNYSNYNNYAPESSISDIRQARSMPNFSAAMGFSSRIVDRDTTPNSAALAAVAGSTVATMAVSPAAANAYRGINSVSGDLYADTAPTPQSSLALSLRTMGHVLAKNDQLFVIFLSTLLLYSAFGIMLGSYVSFFVSHDLLTDSTLYVILGVTYFIQLSMMSLFELLVRITSRSFVFHFSLYLILGGFALMLLTQNGSSIEHTVRSELNITTTLFSIISSTYPILALSMLFCHAGIGLCKVALTSMTVDTVDYGEFKLSVRTDGLIFSLRTMALKLGSILSFFFYGSAISSTFVFEAHRALGVANSSAININIAVGLASTLIIITIFIYFNYYKLNGVFYRNVLNNLQYLRQTQGLSASGSNSGSGSSGSSSSSNKNTNAAAGNNGNAANSTGVGTSTSVGAGASHDSSNSNKAGSINAGSINAGGVQFSRFMLRYALDESTMIIKLKARSCEYMVKAMVQKLSEVNAITSEHDYMSDLKKRLDLGPCGIAEGIALPHAKSSAVRRATVVVATLDRPLDLGALDNRKCDLIFLLASPDDGYTHLNLLGRLSLLLNEPGFADKLRSSGSPTELFERLIQCEKHIMR